MPPSPLSATLPHILSVACKCSNTCVRPVKESFWLKGRLCNAGAWPTESGSVSLGGPTKGLARQSPTTVLPRRRESCPAHLPAAHSKAYLGNSRLENSTTRALVGHTSDRGI